MRRLSNREVKEIVHRHTDNDKVSSQTHFCLTLNHTHTLPFMVPSGRITAVIALKEKEQSQSCVSGIQVYPGPPGRSCYPKPVPQIDSPTRTQH